MNVKLLVGGILLFILFVSLYFFGGTSTKTDQESPSASRVMNNAKESIDSSPVQIPDKAPIVFPVSPTKVSEEPLQPLQAEPMSKEEFMEKVRERKEALLEGKSDEERERYERAQERKEKRQAREEQERVIDKVYKEERDAWREARREAKLANDEERLEELEESEPDKEEIEKRYSTN